MIRVLKEDNYKLAFKELSSKSVMDSDGFLTDYTLYEVYDGSDISYVCILGDKEVYTPDNYAESDFDTDSKREAIEWFNSYTGFDEYDEAKQPNQYSGAGDMKSNNTKFFYQLIDYAKKNKSKFMYIKSNSIAFKKSNGVYYIRRNSNPKKADANVYLDGDPLATITTLDEFINLVNKGDTK